MLTKTNTSWNASLYDDKHSFVFKYGEDLISMLAPQAGERILDLGCGTGHLTQQISLTGARVTGIDSSAAMIDKASAIFPDIDFQPWRLGITLLALLLLLYGLLYADA